MNYVLHLNKTFEKFCEDERLTPFHVSLYYSLFQFWNMARFRNPISISRDELMHSSKIGSVNTYIRCMKELDKWGYIEYRPSFNPQKGSQVYLYNFNNSNDNGSNISSDKGSDKTVKKTADKASETQVIPSINNTNKLNNTKGVNGNTPAQKKIITKKNISDGNSKKQCAEKKKSSAKKEKKISLSFGEGRKGEVGGLPTSENIANYFAEMQWPTIEGKKFYNHYESNGWLVGGKTPMKNWKAASKNWMLNAEKFNNGQARHTAGKLHSSTDKNYNEPL
jgi:hypothetical protein